MNFPQPTKLPGMRSRWRLSDIERFENGHTNRAAEDERFLSAVQLAERYSISRVSVWKLAGKADTAGGAG
jgi:predicted DNA-binding transcriptional regulator AlpA